MINKTKYLMASTALVAFMLPALPSLAETVTRETVIQTTGSPTVKKTVTHSAPSDSGATIRTTVTTGAPTTTRTETRWKTEQSTISGIDARSIDFIEFDINQDAILSIDEVGRRLFELYDIDGNNVIDNIEYERRAIATIRPVEKNTVISYDFDGDGLVDETRHTYETFLQDSLLTRFDTNRNGLSPREFMDTDFMLADINNDKVVDLKEWQGSYMPALDKTNKEKALLNK
jgi:hypothetical protein